MIGVTWVGREKYFDECREYARKFPDKVGNALEAEAGIEVTESKRKTPVQYGNLRASTHHERYVRNGRDISVRIVVGGVAADYAIYVHEDLEAHHTVGQAKFLESTIMESGPYIPERVARRLGMRSS